jgi:4-hydroxythreonine-4-phosphate dehydrogenase
LADALRFMKRTDLAIHAIHSPSEGKFVPGTIDVLDLKNVDMGKLEYGQVSAMCGKASGEYIAKAAELAMQGTIDGMVTCPIHKESFKLGGYGQKYAGHTEMLAGLTHTKKYSMMLAHGQLRTVHVSTHVSLRQACDLVRKQRILEVIEIAHAACVSMGIVNPKIGVAGLNPHAGDGGIFGREEIEEVIPAIQAAKEKGFNVEGPFSADSLYSKARGGWYDIVVSMYHDQGHIPLKFAGFEWSETKKEWATISGVNITLGLPIIRVSVDHGTAFGKAGKGTANDMSVVDAMDYAIRFAEHKQKNKSADSA